MINELRVKDLGVIDEVSLVLDEGMTAITGETGAGKTLVVEALGLLLGDRADAAMIRAGAAEVVVEGSFFAAGDDHVVARTVPRSGRSRCTLDGALSTRAALEDFGSELVDLHGQHAHQSLLRPAEQRRALDRFAAVDGAILERLRAELRAIDERLSSLGGDDALREREVGLLRHELAEIDAVGLTDAEEDERLATEEESLAHSVEIAELLGRAQEELSGAVESSVGDALGRIETQMGQYRTLAALRERVAALATEVSDLTTEIRRAREGVDVDTAALDRVRERRSAISRLRKRFGDSCADVIAAADERRHRLAELERADTERQELLATRTRAVEEIFRAECAIGDQRRSAAGPLAGEVEHRLHDLGLAKARFGIELAPEGLGDDVTFLFAANAGEPVLPLARVASGGELARAMLALRLVLHAGPPTLVFDEVDAGIGGAAALAVGRALRELARDHQVVVVTHLAQVAAFADTQVAVEKSEERGRSVAHLRSVEGEARLEELARMLSGHPDSASARAHAAELLRTTGDPIGNGAASRPSGGQSRPPASVMGSDDGGGRG